jgi:hypothetical protein
MRPSTGERRPADVGTLTLTTDGRVTAVPVYDVRDRAHQRAIARELALGRVAAFYLGLYTIMRVLRPPWTEGPDADLFWEIKAGRPHWSKLPLFCKPQDALRLIDFRFVHPDYRHLAQRERFSRLWQSHGAPLHIIAPLRQPLRYLHPAFQTLPTDLVEQAADNRHAADRLIPCATASFFWMDDPAWESLATLIRLSCLPHAFMGGSSFNDHGAQPPYTRGELASYVQARGRLQFDLVVADHLFESTRAFSSHSLVRLPLVGEPPELVMLRYGSVSPGWLAESTGYPVRLLESASVASRHPSLSDADVRRGLEELCRLRGR